MRQVLGAVTDTQYGKSALNAGQVRKRCAGIPDRIWTSRKNEALHRSVRSVLGVVRPDLAINIEFSYPPCYQLGILGTEIQNDYFFLHLCCFPSWISKYTFFCSIGSPILHHCNYMGITVFSSIGFRENLPGFFQQGIYTLITRRKVADKQFAHTGFLCKLRRLHRGRMPVIFASFLSWSEKVASKYKRLIFLRLFTSLGK